MPPLISTFTVFDSTFTLLTPLVFSGSTGGELGYLRWTPHAFSHFTFEASGGRELVVDIQGVEDLYTDPAVHSFSSQGFGSGNSGPEGMLNFFLTHRCSPLCQSMGLLPFLCTDQELNSGTELGTASDAADTAATAGEGGSSPKTGVIRNRGARSGGGRGVLGSEVEAEALSRVGSGATLVESHELYVRRSIHVAADTRADLVESMGRLHAKLALHYMPKRYSYTTGREEGDALAEAVARLRCATPSLLHSSFLHHRSLPHSSSLQAEREADGGEPVPRGSRGGVPTAADAGDAPAAVGGWGVGCGREACRKLSAAL